MDFWSLFPGRDNCWHGTKKWHRRDFLVNAHPHTPYSFSAFRDIPQALDMAVKRVKVMESTIFIPQMAMRNGHQRLLPEGYPLFNIEYIT